MFQPCVSFRQILLRRLHQSSLELLPRSEIRFAYLTQGTNAAWEQSLRGRDSVPRIREPRLRDFREKADCQEIASCYGVLRPSGSDAGGCADAGGAGCLLREYSLRDPANLRSAGWRHDLQQAGPGTFKGPTKGGFDAQPIADMAPITIMGHPTRNFPVQVQSQLSVPSSTSACRPSCRLGAPGRESARQ